MSATDPPNSLSLPMPEPSRTRSDSLEESGSRQDRKRPRLSSSNTDELSSEEAVTDSGCPEPDITLSKTPAAENTDSPTVTSPHHSNKMPTSPAGQPSKVTINTRNSHANPPKLQSSTPPQSPDSTKTPGQGLGADNKSSDTDSAPEIVAVPPDTVSISSSPGKSPEIQVAELEDIDQNPGETRWTPITRFSSNLNRQEFPTPHHVYQTFPYAAANSSFGAVHAMIPRLTAIFENGGTNDDGIFLELKQWLSNFVQNTRALSTNFLREEPRFWQDFPEVVASLLRRRIDLPQQARINDLVDFFVDYGRLTLLFIEHDLDRLRTYSDATSPDLISELTCKPYILVLPWILQYRQIPFYDMIYSSLPYNPANLVSAVVDRLADAESINMIDSLTNFVEQLSLFLPRKVGWLPTFQHFLAIVINFTKSVPERKILNADLELTESRHIGDILRHSLKFFNKVDAILQVAITKQSPWLTIENSPELIGILYSMLDCIAAEDRDLVYEALRSSETDFSAIPEDADTLVACYAWKFKTLHKYVTAGRMELRVYGMETMQSDLVAVWRRFIHCRPVLKEPLVRYLVKFIQDTKLVEYIVGVESHPQLISRSPNVIGFLCVTLTYSEADSDTIWRTVSQSQDPRTIAEVLLVLKSILPMSQLSAMLYLCDKVMTLPIHRFDSRTLEFVGDLLLKIQQKYHENRRLNEFADALPFKLSVRILRDASASLTCSPEQKAALQNFATEQLLSLLRNLQISNDETQSLWELCVKDVAQMNAHATGSLQALNAWTSSNPGMVTPRLVEAFDFTKLLIENVASATAQSVASSNAEAAFVESEFPARLRMLSLMLDYAPHSVTESLREALWTNVFNSISLPRSARRSAWIMLSNVISRRALRNVYLDSIIEDYLPRIDPSDFDDKILEFVKLSVEYEIRFSGTIQPDENGVVTIPGIDRVWRFILQAPNGTVEMAATEFVISQYLDHPVMVGQTRSVIEATHLSLVDRCVRQVIGAASRLRSFSEGTMSGEDEPMIIVASPAEICAEQMHFDRSLLFLRQLLQGMKLRPRYSPPPTRPTELPRKAFQDRGNIIVFPYQTFGDKQANLPMKKISIGDMNTGDELAHYLIELTGFTQFIGISGGKRVELFGNESPLRDLRIGNGLLMVRKVPDTPEKQIDGRSRPPNPIDSKVIDHFNELYDLLSLEDRLAKEVFGFLDLFPAQDRVRDQIQTMQASAEVLLPTDKPYKLLYCAKALRSCVEAEAFNTNPNREFLNYSVRTITAAFTRPETDETEESLRLQIAYVLTECLLLALRAPVPADTSSAYIPDPEGYARCVMQMTAKAQASLGLEAARIEAYLLVREPFAALVEGTLHNEQLWEYLHSDPDFDSLILKILCEDIRVDVRKAVADVIFGLTGTSGTKVLYKPQDPRSARSRFSASKIDASLAHWWNILVELLPKAVKKPLQCQQLFDVSIDVLHCVGKSMTPNELCSCFESWSKLLIGYRQVEIIGRASDDHVVWGFTKLLNDCYQLLQTLGIDIPTSQLAKDLLSIFLFPDLSDGQPGQTSLTPVLKDVVREDLYNLVLSLSKTQDDLDSILDHIDGVVAKDTYFEPNIPNDRQALRSEVGYAGIRNLSNTCYLNSLFSQLFMNLEFREFLFETNVVEEASQRLVAELSKVFSYMQNHVGKFVDPSSAVESIRTYDNEQIDVSIQMDVDEFFNLLFDRIEAQILAPEARKAFRSLYGGQLVQQIKSKECEHISERLEPFSAIQCEIKGKVGLEDSLKAYVEGEVMQGENKYSCTACSRHVNAVKRACLKDVPDHLIFNLKRFDFDITTMTRCKVNDEFQFPEWIDMAPYTVDHLSQPDQPIDSDIFDLVGVLVHSGTAESGHYYSYIRERPSSRAPKDSWVQFNDSEVNVFDHSRIHDCCFGGLDFSSPMNFSKAYNAYMLFYQRRASIQKFEERYREHDLASPVRLPLTPEREQHLALDNELFLRSYCAQDRSHAKFMRQILERMRSGDANRCSPSHETETRALCLVLEYVQQISCRIKDLPEFEATMKILTGYASQCNTCAERIVTWYPSDTNFRDTVLRNPMPIVRKAFSSLLYDSLRMLKLGTRTQGLPKSRLAERNERYRLLLRRCIDTLEDQWEDMSKWARAWNDYFELLAHISSIGVFEASLILEAGFLEKVLEIIWIDGRGDPKKLKRKYLHYVTVREKGRVFSHHGLLSLLHTLLERLNLDLGIHPDGEREESRKLLGATPSEMRLICPNTTQHHTGVKIEWLRRVIVGCQNPVAIGGIVGNLAQYEELAFFAANTLIMGLAADQVAEAATYLEPTQVFCSRCPSEQEVLRVVREALGGIDSINSHFGRDHFHFVAELMNMENESLGWDRRRFQTLVLVNADSWAPALLLYPESVHYDVAQETVDLLTEYLLGPLESPHVSTHEKAVLRDYALKLVNGCVKHIRTNYIPGRSETLSSLEVGQTKHIAKVVAHIVEHYFPSDSAEDESRIELVRQTMAALELRVQTVVETLSESWADNESPAVSDSDNADLQDFAANTP